MIGASPDSARQVLAEMAPLAPTPLRRVVAVMLTSDRFSSDALLIVADALAEASDEIDHASYLPSIGPRHAGSLRVLASLLRDAAPLHAKSGVP